MDRLDRLYTWLDVENRILQKKYGGKWPPFLSGITVYSDEMEIRIQAETDRNAAESLLAEWFGPRFINDKQCIHLESSFDNGKRCLPVAFEVEPGSTAYTPLIRKTDFAAFSLYPETIDLEPPDFQKTKDNPPIWAFYSFKGGVSRSIHCIAVAKAISEKFPQKKILIVDGDLEAPGLTWWGEKDAGEFEISFLDFLALIHYDVSLRKEESLALTAERVRKQVLLFPVRTGRVEHYFLPAFRDIHQLMRIPVRPEHVVWESGKEWIIPELLGRLASLLGVSAVLVDLRAGLSEISSPLLFDPRIHRVIVTTSSDQSVQGTLLILRQYRKVIESLRRRGIEQESIHPRLILTMVREDLKNSEEMDAIRENLQEMLMPPPEADFLGENPVVETLFDERLLLLKSLPQTLEKLEGTDLQNRMTEMVDNFFPAPMTVEKRPFPVGREADLEKLSLIAEQYEFAESGAASKFLTTQSLRNIARKFEKELPVAVLMGAKGSGKTYCYLQIARRKNWKYFIGEVNRMESRNDALILPLTASENLEGHARKLIEDCITHIRNEGIKIDPIPPDRLREKIDARLRSPEAGYSSAWMKFWFDLMAETLQIPLCEDPLPRIQKTLAERDIRIIFQIDGLEDRFQKLSQDSGEQEALLGLCQGVINRLQDWPENRIGLLVFIRKDLVKSAIRQNFGQFEARFQSFEFKWNSDEALRLVGWLVGVAGGLTNIVPFPSDSSEEIMGRPIKDLLIPLWGKKMGKPESSEAYTHNWVIAALSDFKGQMQARDIVRLIRFSALEAMEKSVYADRILPPQAIRNALDPCSEKKIEEIAQEINMLKTIFEKLKGLPGEKRQVPFTREFLNLQTEEIDALTQQGMIIEYGGKYYMPEIIRRGLGFTLLGGARPKVLTLLRRASKKVSPGFH